MVSVIIPTYNRANIIKRSIESVLTQSYQDFEIIIVDDLSTDDTSRVIQEFNDSRIYYLKNEKRMGANGARNAGIQCAHGDYIAFQDSDDIWRNDKLEKQMCMFQKRKELDIVYSRYIRHCADGKAMLVPEEKYAQNLLQEEISHTLASLNVIGTPTMIVKKKCFDECRMFDLNIPRFQDWEINIEFVQHYKYGFIDEALVDAYVSTDSITNTTGTELVSKALILKKHQEFFDTYGTMDIHLANLANIALNEKRLGDLQELLGDTFFYKSIYLNIEKIIKKQEVIQKNYLFVKEWLFKEADSNLINSFLSRYPDDSIALYGLGDIGKLFLNVLSDENEKKIRYVIDRNLFATTKFIVLPLEGLGDEDFDGIKYIIITAIAHEEAIRQELARVTTVPVISVYDVIKDASDKGNISAKET